MKSNFKKIKNSKNKNKFKQILGPLQPQPPPRKAIAYCNLNRDGVRPQIYNRSLHSPDLKPLPNRGGTPPNGQI